MPGLLYDLGAYPAAVPDPAAAGRIRGELAAVPEDPGLWALLDRYEGWRPEAPASSLFRRERCLARPAQGEPVTAWIYAYCRDPGGAPLLPDGWVPDLGRPPGRYRGR